MKLWKEILIQYVLIIGIYNIIVYTIYDGGDEYFYLAFPMILYMILMPAVTNSINKSSKTAVRKAILKTILPLFFGIFLIDSEIFYLFVSLIYFIPCVVSLAINLYIAHKQKKNDNFKH